MYLKYPPWYFVFSETPQKGVRGTFCFQEALKNCDMVLLLFSTPLKKGCVVLLTCRKRAKTVMWYYCCFRKVLKKRVYGTFAVLESPQKTAIWYLVNGKTSKKVQRWYLDFYCIKSVHLCHRSALTLCGC